MNNQGQSDNAKKSAELVERVSVVDEPLKTHHGIELDKFGAAPKTDPAEIALVKKIDLYMLPILWLMWYVVTARTLHTSPKSRPHL
jgi:hypothetical protein